MAKILITEVKKIRDFLFLPENLSRFITCAALYTFSLLPIILVYRIQQDDLGRSIQDYRSWSSDGRPISYFFQYLMGMGEPLINLFPLYQFISVGIFSISALLISGIFEIKRPFYLAISTLPLIAQPYFLQAMSYAFDALSISVAILLAVAAVAAPIRDHSAPRIAASAFLLCASLATYQPAAITFVLIYFGAVIYQISQIGWRDNIMRLFVGLLIITTAISLYFILLKSRIFGRLDSYAISHMEVFSPHEFLTGVILNATRYWSLLLADWSGTALGWIVLALSIVAGICLILPNPGRSGNCSFTGRVSALLFLGALTLLSMGHLLIKHDPSFVPRWFVGAGVMLSLFNLILLGRVGMDGVNAVIRFAGQGLVLLLAYSIILVAFSYGQARSAQKDFEAALLTRLVGDVTPMLNDRKVSEVTIVGMMPRSPILAQTVRKFPALDRIVVRNFRDDYIFGQLQLMHYGVNLKYAKQTNTLLKQLESNDNIFVDKFLYELHVIGRTLIIVFPSDQATVSNS